MRSDILLAAKKAQFCSIRYFLFQNYVGGRCKLGTWNDHAYFCAGFNVGYVQLFNESNPSVNTIYRHMYPYKMDGRGRSVVYRLERDLCDSMAAVAIDQLKSIGLSETNLVLKTATIKEAFKALPLFTGEENAS
jgi:hypothetical protein